ncbi:LuxR family transcriptional regulator [Paenibacillus sp. FSL W8-1187]|uniref:LuxR family transcriptional regulator n=1 Tax=Paenibacillus sp. FSL W8-1187 TaxID=2975339 RepID=UPI0030DD7ADA
MTTEHRHLRSAYQQQAPDEAGLVGREKEMRLFAQLLTTPSSSLRIVNVHGTGGIGKTALLAEFGRMTRQSGIPYAMLDSRLFSHSPAEFCNSLLRSLNAPTPKRTLAGQTALAQACGSAIAKASDRGAFVLAIDTFEECGELEQWLRDDFLNCMPEGLILILSGRFALKPAWHAAPPWERMIYRLPIGDLDYEATRAYLHRCGIDDEAAVHALWTRTRGHPLTLTLLISTSLASLEQESRSVDEEAMFGHVVQTWLREVPDPATREIIESAAVARYFNQEMLEQLMARPVPTDQFRSMISHSFIQRIDRGWLLHELLREAIAYDLRMRKPDRYNRLWRRCMRYYTNKLKRSARSRSVSLDNADFLYYIGNQFIHYIMYKQWVSSSVEPLGPSNREEAERYVARRKQTAKDGVVPFHNQDGSMTTFLISRRESLLVLGQIRLQELYELGHGCVKLIRNGQGEVCGLIEIIPINAHTMDYLLTAPLSRAYFNALPGKLRQELAVAAPGKSGYFVRTLDVYDFSDFTMMHASLSTLISHILSTGYIVAAPIGNPVSNAICSSLGMDEVTEVRNLDYDGVTSAAYFVMDTRGNRVHDYVERMVVSFGGEEERDGEAALSRLSRREREVVERVMQGRSNMELARDLYLSEGTVKKHLANIFRKLEVKSRAQLIRKVSAENAAHPGD